MPLCDLDERLLAAHAAYDRPALIELYMEAAQSVASEDAAGFYLTHAYVFALEAGDKRAADIKATLVHMRRDV